MCSGVRLNAISEWIRKFLGNFRHFWSDWGGGVGVFFFLVLDLVDLRKLSIVDHNLAEQCNFGGRCICPPYQNFFYWWLQFPFITTKGKSNQRYVPFWTGLSRFVKFPTFVASLIEMHRMSDYLVSLRGDDSESENRQFKRRIHILSNPMFLTLIRDNLNAPPELITQRNTARYLACWWQLPGELRMIIEAPSTCSRVINIYSQQIDAKMMFTFLMY